MVERLIEYLATGRRTGYIQYESPPRPGSARDYTSYPVLEATRLEFRQYGSSPRPGSARDYTSYPALEATRLEFRQKRYFQIAKDFYSQAHKINHRHVYNVKNFFNVSDIKNCLLQCFFHIYRQRIYEFIIVDIVKFVEKTMNVINHIEYLIDFVLNFFVYKLFKTQAIYELFSIMNDLLYFIQTSYESN